MADNSVFACNPGIFFACDNGLRFLGCCTYDHSPAVCDFGCPDGALEPAYFKLEFYSDVNASQPGHCDHGYDWNMCQVSSEYYFFGCYRTAEDPCSDFSLEYLGNATSPDDTDPATTTTTYAATPAPSSVTTSIAQQSNVFHIPSSIPVTQTAAPPDIAATSHSPAQKASIGAIAGGSVGGIVAVAAWLGFLVLYYFRRKRRLATDKQPSEDPISGKSTDEGSKVRIAIGG